MKPATFVSMALWMTITACGDDDPIAPGPPPSGDVAVRNDFFSPDEVTPSVGAEVTWAWNSGGREHNVTFEDGNGNSATQGSGAHARTFTSAGTFRYRCTIHSSSYTSGMVGQVVVQ